MINCAAFIGRLTANPTLKTTTTGKEVCKFTVAVDRAISKGEKKADFIPVVAWEGTAKFVCDYFTKGSMIAVQGTIQTGTYEDGKGNKRATFEVVAKEISFCGSKNEGGQTRKEQAEEKPDMTTGLNGYYSNATAADFEEIVCDDEFEE